MRKFLIAGVMAASILPAAAQAQWIDNRERAELRRDRAEIRDERRDLDRAYRYGDRDDIREERGELRDAKRDYRETYRDARRDWGRNDWRDYRRSNRDLYRSHGWRSDYRYHAFRPGSRVGIGYYAPRYQLNDYNRYRLARPGYGQRWVRHYNDVLLIDVRRGYVVDVIRNFYW
ncbi:MAG: RcnB family protein [Sphingomonadaceae bacterium]